MTTAIDLTGVRRIRRKDAYSLATRALVAKSLGLALAKPLALGSFTMGEQPSANVHFHLLTTSVFTHMRFCLAAAAVPWVLEDLDCGENLDAAIRLSTAASGTS